MYSGIYTLESNPELWSGVVSVPVPDYRSCYKNSTLELDTWSKGIDLFRFTKEQIDRSGFQTNIYLLDRKIKKKQT